MKTEKGQGAQSNDNGGQAVETGTPTAQPAPATAQVRDLKSEAAEKEAEHDHEAAAPILRTFTTNVLQMGTKVREASEGKALVKEVGTTLTEHIDAAITALEGAGLKGPRLSRVMHAEFAKVLESVGASPAYAKDLIGRRCTKYGHRQRAPKAGEEERRAVAAKVKEAMAAQKAMAAGSVADQVERFRAYWKAATAEQRAAIRAVVEAEAMEPATV